MNYDNFLKYIFCVATTKVKRVFPRMKYIKNNLWNSMYDQILNNCLVIFIESNLFLQFLLWYD